jgi:hypothetical protein
MEWKGRGKKMPQETSIITTRGQKRRLDDILSDTTEPGDFPRDNSTIENVYQAFGKSNQTHRHRLVNDHQSSGRIQQKSCNDRPCHNLSNFPTYHATEEGVYDLL